MCKTLILFYAALLIVTGCDKKNEIPTKEKNDTIYPERKNSVPIEINREMFDGLYTTNINASTFQDCLYPDSIYLVIDETKKLEGQYAKIFSEPSIYGSVAVSLKGQLGDNKSIKTKEKFPRALFVSEVISVKKKNFTNICIPYDFWCLGNEPNWSLEISEKENLIELFLPSESKTYYFFYAEPKMENGSIIYSNYNRIQRNIIKVKIKKEQCTDNFSHQTFDYSAEVELTGEKKFRGCAIPGKNLK